MEEHELPTKPDAPVLDDRLAEILAGSPRLTSFDVHEMRAHARMDKARWSGGVCDGLALSDRMFKASSGPRPMRVLTPRAARGRPVLFIHGGGWTICDTDTHLALFAGLAHASLRQVIAPHARRAPEHPYPAPLDDTVDALQHMACIHPDGFFLAGDSAGANLALAALLRLSRDGHRPPVLAMVAYYGCFRRVFDTPSHLRNGDGRFGFSTEKMRRFWSLYCGDAMPTPQWADLSDQDLSTLPPVQVHAAEADPLLDDSHWLHEAIGSGGGQVEFVLWPGMTHGFLHYLRALPQAGAAFVKSAEFLTMHERRQ